MIASPPAAPAPGILDTAASTVRIAVVIVTRNRRAALDETIASMRALRDPRVRLYVVDGASTDGTVDDLRASDHGDLEWLSEPDRGIYDAMNKGWKMPPSDAYVLYLGTGDKVTSLPPDETFAHARQQGIDILIGTCLIGTWPFRSDWHAGLHVQNTAHHQALLVRKSLHPEPPFDASMRMYADWDFNLRLFKRGLRAQFDSAFHSYAEPGGVSTHHDLGEVWRVSRRHGGAGIAARAYWINLKGKVKRQLESRGLR